MLGIDISVLTLAELRRLLKAAESRGQEALAEQLRAELAGRQGGRPRAAPVEPGAFDTWEPAPIRLGDDADDFRLERERRPARPRRRLWPWGLAAAAATAAGGLAWGLIGAPPLEAPRPAPPAAAPPAARSAAAPAAPPRAMTARAEPAPVAPVPPPTEQAPPAASPEPAAERAPQKLARAAPEPRRPTRLDPCARAATPADRLVCSDLALDFLDRRMKAAYSRALATADDPGALAADQAAWRAERNPVSDPQALAQLYDRRTRELEEAATPR